MELLVERILSNTDATLGNLFIAGLRFMCATCEDEYRVTKVMGETRIPAGRFELKLRAEGGIHAKYLERYGPTWHKGMLHLQNVPGFDFVLIHVGNDDDDTEGCLLVGLTADYDAMTIGASRPAYEKLYPVVRDALLKGEQVFITIADRDR